MARARLELAPPCVFNDFTTIFIQHFNILGGMAAGRLELAPPL